MFKLYGERKEFFQWDLNQKIIVEDSSITEVHFWNGIEECALVCEVYEENGKRLANVPNILLQERLSIRVYAYCGDCYTKDYKLYKVTPREKPADYVYTETEIKSYEKLDERIAKLEENNGGTISSDLYSNALKGAASGTAVALDVSPIEHILKIKATSDTADVSTAKVQRYGGNILSYPFYDTTKTSGGVTFTDNGDGSIHIKGTATADVYFILARNVWFGDKKIDAILKNEATNGQYTVSKWIFYNEGNELTSITVPSGQAIDETFYPQVALGTTLPPYEPYRKPTTYDISTNGTVEGVTSLYPTTTLMSDTEGVVLDVEYNRDINKAFAELQNAIISLGGNI